jgi:hypothetical protein
MPVKYRFFHKRGDQDGACLIWRSPCLVRGGSGLGHLQAGELGDAQRGPLNLAKFGLEMVWSRLSRTPCGYAVTPAGSLSVGSLVVHGG